MTSSEGSSGSGRGVHLVPGGLRIGAEEVPLLAGSVHYWRLDPRDWRACLLAVKDLGLRLVDTYVPWSVHEVAPGQLELGRGDPQRDVGAFLRLAHEVGLFAIVRPGPHINAELTGFGIPERVLWDPSCQARSPRGNPVMLPMLPYAFPVPSYASESFHDETARYFQLLGPTLAPLLYPAGPIVMLQIDNEGALYFRDGAYDQDYHPDAVTLYRAFLREKYGTLERLQAAYPRREGEPTDTERRFATLMPPQRFEAQGPVDLARHLDWSEFHEHLLETAFERFGRALSLAGLDGVPTCHNLPPGQEATPLNAARVRRSVDLVGLDYYNVASAQSRTIVARRTSELSVRTEALGLPAFASEMGAGFPPFFPPIQERDSAFIVLAALAYGLRGYNVYMAVERDRWIGAPIDPHGRPRPFAAFWQRLSAALARVDFYHLVRRTPVRILTPRSERRLARVMHAFGPITGAFFSVAGNGPRESASEQDPGLGYAPAIESDSFARTFEQALDARGVPFAHIGGEDRDVSLDGARWIVCATSGGFNPELWQRLAEAAAGGALITLGPREPAFDGAFRALGAPFDLGALRGAHPDIPVVVADDPAVADAAVAHAVEALGLPAHACDPDGIFATLHQDAAGRPRVLFVLNPGEHDVLARVHAGEVTRAVDLFDDAVFDVQRGALEVRMTPHTVRMLALE
jgi:beta-galactosidase